MLFRPYSRWLEPWSSTVAQRPECVNDNENTITSYCSSKPSFQSATPFKPNDPAKSSIR